MPNFLNGSSSLWILYGVIRHEFMLQSSYNSAKDYQSNTRHKTICNQPIY